MARKTTTARKATVTALAWFIGFLIFFPILWTILTSFKTEGEAIAAPPSFLFFDWTMENYLTVNERSDYPRHFWNSVVISVGSTLLGLLIAIPAAWAMAFVPGKRTKDVLMWMLSTKMMPAVGVLKLMAEARERELQAAQKALAACDRLKAGIAAIDGVKVIGSEHCTIVTWTSAAKDVDVYAVADQLEDRGWHVDRQQHPACVHLTVTANHLPVVDDYLRDLKDAVAFVRAHPEVKSRGNAAMYGMMAKVPLRAMVKQAALKVMEGMYGKDGGRDDVDLQASQGSGLVDLWIAKNQETVLRALDVVDDVAGEAIARFKQRRGMR